MAVKLRINDISFSYSSMNALDGVTLEINESEAVSLVGPNGAGKSTLLKCIDKILKPQKGVILLDGENTAKIDSVKLSRKMSYVPQNNVEVFPFTIFDIVLMGRKPHMNWRVNREDISIVAKTLKFLRMEDFGQRYFDELSGGEKQKVVIARAIAQEPRILLMDEPTSNLDIKHQLEVMEIVQELIHVKRISVIMAMHDLNLAARFSDRVVMLKDKKVFKIGTPETVFSQDHIREVYGIETQIIIGQEGKPVVIPIAAGSNGRGQI